MHKIYPHIQAADFTQALQQVAFKNSGSITLEDKCIKVSKEHSNRSTFKTIVALAAQFLASNTLTKEQKFDLGISLSLITDRFTQKPPRWYFKLPILSWIYQRNKSQQNQSAMNVSKALLSEFPVASDLTDANHRLASMSAGQYVILKGDNRWKFLQKKPVVPTKFCFITPPPSISSHKELTDCLSTAAAKEYYGLLGIFHEKKQDVSTTSFLSEIDRLKHTLIVTQELSGHFTLYRKLPSCTKKIWIQKCLQLSENIHSAIDTLLHPNKEHLLRLLENYSLYNPTKNIPLHSLRPEQFQELTHKEYVVINSDQSLCFVQKLKMAQGAILRTELLTMPHMLEQLESILNQTDTYIARCRTYQTHHLHHNIFTEDLFRIFFGTNRHRSSFDSFFRPSFSTTSDFARSCARNNLLDAKAKVVAIIAPERISAEVTFSELTRLRKQWILQNSHDRGGNLHEVQLLNQAWDALQEQINSHVRVETINEKLMQELDLKYTTKYTEKKLP